MSGPGVMDGGEAEIGLTVRGYVSVACIGFSSRNDMKGVDTGDAGEIEVDENLDVLEGGEIQVLIYASNVFTML